MNKICAVCGKDARGRKAKRYREGKMILCFHCSFDRAKNISDMDKDKRQPMQSIKSWLVEKRGNKCERCGSTFGIVAHHKIRMMDNGTNNDDNIELLCADCHGAEHKGGTGA